MFLTILFLLFVVLFCLKPCGVSDELSPFDSTEKRFFGFGRARAKTFYLSTVFVVSSLIQLKHDFVGAVVAVAVAVAVAELASTQKAFAAVYSQCFACTGFGTLVASARLGSFGRAPMTQAADAASWPATVAVVE